jgi:hypothetical protein
LNVQHTLDEKPLGKFENAIRTGGKIVSTLDPLHMLFNTGEPLYGCYLPLTEGALGHVVRRGIGFYAEER